MEDKIAGGCGETDSAWPPGGGGYITGLIQHPVDGKVLYARCDVAGSS
ncbi:hypothetical protein [Paenibacillus sp. S150]|nr:hypothetical protein [Paenibacillus sp. S150]MBW4080757.1 hypothetical protein [Paenibacillus sp. S150]